MNLPSLEFLLALLLVVTVFHLIPSRRPRQWLLGCCNAAFICFSLPNYWSWLAVGVFAFSGYAAARLLQKKPRAGIFTAYLLLLIAGFMVLKKYAMAAVLLPEWVMSHPVGVVGLSYMLFRQIHFVVDAMQQQVTSFSLWTYANYQFDLFGFISGPIQRYQEFEHRWHDMRPLLTTRYEVMRAYLRVFVGVIKVSVISAYFLALVQSQQNRFAFAGALDGVPRLNVLVRFGAIFYGYPLYLYFNFSGYCDVAIASAALLGIKLPENFDRPYLSRNVSDYWTRFHQSLGFWIRDYLFTPMYKAAASRWSTHAQWLVFPCYLIAFVLAGIWHGNSMNFAVFGMLHGLGVCTGKLWEYRLVKRRGRKGLKEYLASPIIRAAAIVATLNFVCFTMLFFPNSVGTTVAMLRNLAHYWWA